MIHFNIFFKVQQYRFTKYRYDNLFPSFQTKRSIFGTLHKHTLHETLVIASKFPNQKFPKCKNSQSSIPEFVSLWKQISTTHDANDFASTLPNQKFPKGIFYILQKYFVPKLYFCNYQKDTVPTYCIQNIYTTNIKNILFCFQVSKPKVSKRQKIHKVPFQNLSPFGSNRSLNGFENTVVFTNFCHSR